MNRDLKYNFEDVDISLTIKNNTGYTQTVTAFTSPFNLRATSVNALKEYRYDLTGFSFTTETYITLQYRHINEASFSLYTCDLSSQTLASVIVALNALGIGYFYTYTSGLNTYISTINDTYVFGDLSILPDAGTTTTTTTTTAAPTTTTTTSTTTAAPTTTTTTTTTTTIPIFTYCLGYDASSDAAACADYITFCT